MKIRSERDKRTYLIITLCALLVVMGAGYAAFSSLLTINGTANISNSWCVGFDNTMTNALIVTKGVSTGTQPTGSMSYSGTACGSNLQPNSSLNAHFYQPGDEIEYTLTITNKSTVAAAIKSILVDNESVTSNTTKKKGNITYVVEMPAKTTLAVNESTTMKVIAKFQNETDVTGNANGETQSIEVKINAEQDDGNGGFTPTTSPTTVYAYDTDSRTIGTSKILDGVSDYTELSSYQNGKTWFLKYELDESNVIQKAWACQKFSFINEPVCLQGGTTTHYGTISTGNRGIIENLASIFNSNGGSCSTDNNGANCFVNGLDISTNSNGRATANNSQSDFDQYCTVHETGIVYCGEIIS